MADAGNQEFPTIIGPDASFKGELSFEKGLRLMGKFEGRINSGGRLHIAKEARLQADVESGAIIVEGEVKGNLTANDRIELQRTRWYSRASGSVIPADTWLDTAEATVSLGARELACRLNQGARSFAKARDNLARAAWQFRSHARGVPLAL